MQSDHEDLHLIAELGQNDEHLAVDNDSTLAVFQPEDATTENDRLLSVDNNLPLNNFQQSEPSGYEIKHA